MRWTTKLLAIAAVAVALVPSAPANAAGVYPGAGYKVTGLRLATATFAMPHVDCSDRDSTEIVQFGLFSPDLRWRAVETAVCLGDRPQFSLDINNADNGTGIGGDNIGWPGHKIQVKMSTAADGTTLQVFDLSGRRQTKPLIVDASSVAAAGAYSERVSPGFATATMGLTANGSVPFAKLDYVRHVQIRDGVRVIGAGFPWNDGEHFHLYFKNH